MDYEQEVVSLQIKLNGIMSLIKEERELLGLEPGQSSLGAIRGLLRGCSEKEQVIEQISEKPVRKKRKSVFSKQERKVIIQELKDLGIKFNERGSTSTMAKKWVEYLEERLAMKDIMLPINPGVSIYPQEYSSPNTPTQYVRIVPKGEKVQPDIFDSDKSPYDCSAPRRPNKLEEVLEEVLKDKSPYDCSEPDEPADIAFLRKNGHI